MKGHAVRETGFAESGRGLTSGVTGVNYNSICVDDYAYARVASEIEKSVREKESTSPAPPRKSRSVDSIYSRNCRTVESRVPVVNIGCASSLMRQCSRHAEKARVSTVVRAHGSKERSWKDAGCVGKEQRGK